MLARRGTGVVSRIRRTVGIPRFSTRATSRRSRCPRSSGRSTSTASRASLTVESGDVTKKIYLLGGNIIFATSTDRSRLARRVPEEERAHLVRRAANVRRPARPGRRASATASSSSRWASSRDGPAPPDRHRAGEGHPLLGRSRGRRATVTFEVGRFRTDELIRLDVSDAAGDRRRHPAAARPAARASRASDPPGRSSSGARRRRRLRDVSFTRRRADAPLAGGRAAHAARPHHGGSRRLSARTRSSSMRSGCCISSRGATS